MPRTLTCKQDISAILPAKWKDHNYLGISVSKVGNSVERNRVKDGFGSAIDLMRIV